MSRDVCEHFNPVDLPCAKCEKPPTLRTAAQQALEALEVIDKEFRKHGRQHWPEAVKSRAAITALRAALAEPQIDPVDEYRKGFIAGQIDMRDREQAEPVQEPVAWTPIEQLYPQAKAIDILMGDGSILCAVLPQFGGDLWWEGSGTGEKFIDPEYANVTHWRIHGEHTAPPQRKPLTDEEILKAVGWDRAEMYMKLTPNFPVAEAKEETLKNARAIERAHGIGEQP